MQEIDEPVPRLNLFCTLFALAPQFAGTGQSVLQCMSRRETRQHLNIKGSGFFDFCTSVFCSPCGLLQESQELTEWEEGRLRIDERDDDEDW